MNPIGKPLGLPRKPGVREIVRWFNIKTRALDDLERSLANLHELGIIAPQEIKKRRDEYRNRVKRAWLTRLVLLRKQFGGELVDEVVEKLEKGQ